MKYNSNQASQLFDAYNVLAELADSFKRLQNHILYDEEDEAGNRHIDLASLGYYDYMIKDTLKEQNVKSVLELFPFNDSWEESTLIDWCFAMQTIIKKLILQEMKKGEANHEDE